MELLMNKKNKTSFTTTPLTNKFAIGLSPITYIRSHFSKEPLPMSPFKKKRKIKTKNNIK